MPEKKAVPAVPERKAAPEPPQEGKKEGIPALAGKVEGEKGFFSALREKIMTTKISGQQFEDMFSEMEMALLENNVAVEVIDKIKHDLKEALVDHPIRRGRVEETVIVSLKDSIRGLFESAFDIVSRIREKREKPYVIAFVGINGSGKTTSIAKFASYLRERGFSVVLAAADTFRAASIEQISQHGDKLGIRVVKHDYGADPAAVAFDAIKHGKAKGIDVVLIDTAGRMYSNADLVNEMKKIMRVAKPDLKIFVGESITGNDCVEQAKTFNDAVSIDGIILSKADVDEKGGAAVSVSYVTKKPILYIGTGQDYKDLRPFDVDAVMENLGLA
ncbi:TPA: signal recognition particle-docking protein FtsY [Candidatus Woesearchaeota archaeon]|nr:signal recognition particle-docking protein FtsY [Candidatus Woesearchaeota archaeon]